MRGRGREGIDSAPPPPYKYGVRKVISKLAQILPTGALDYIFDDSAENIL
jgi:hypothetical protein